MIKRILIFVALCLSPITAHAKGTVSSADPRASEAGLWVLQQGGTAAEAAMAMMLALTVVEPQSSGIGGGGFLMYHDVASNQTRSIDGRETAPWSVTPDLWMKDGQPISYMDAYPGGKSVGVPGNIRLMAKGHKQWGKLPWAKLFEPAIKLARDGFVVNSVMARRLDQAKTVWTDFPEARAIYWQDGRPKVEGDIVKNPKLAAFLTRLAAEGPDAFYSGENAAAITKAVGTAKRNPTVMTQSDIAAYQPYERDAICRPYRQYKICGMGPPSSGATTVLGILGMLERFDLKKLGPDNPESWNLIGQAMRLGYADRNRYLGDPGFTYVPVGGLLDPDYLNQRSQMIGEDKARQDYPAGNPPGALAMVDPKEGEEHGTTHFIAVDDAGNVASWTSTIEGPFGSQLVVNGYFLNNELTDFTFNPVLNGKPAANAPMAGKRPLSSMSPTIVFDQSGKPVFVVGAAGGKTIIMQVTKALIAWIDWGMPADKALGTPMLFFNNDGLVVEANTPLAGMKDQIAAYGVPVAVSNSLPLKANAAELTPNGWRGAADPRSLGKALEVP